MFIFGSLINIMFYKPENSTVVQNQHKYNTLGINNVFNNFHYTCSLGSVEKTVH